MAILILTSYIVSRLFSLLGLISTYNVFQSSVATCDMHGEAVAAAKEISSQLPIEGFRG
jgi:hypothetical protein